MIVPDVLRVVQPLGSFGFYVDNDGMIFDVTRLSTRSSSLRPGTAGIRHGDKLALSSFAAFPTTPPPAATR